MGTSLRWLFLSAAAMTAVGTGFASVLFESRAGIVSIFLVAIPLSATLSRLLDANRRAIWEEGASSFAANRRLAAGMLALFFGILACTFLAALVLPRDTAARTLDFQLERYGDRYAKVTDIDFGTFRALVSHNGVVLAAFFLLGVAYDAGGVMLILAWNASVWGAVFGHLVGNQHHINLFEGTRYALRTMLVLLPHLAAEGAAYVLVGMAGIFAVRGFRRHRLGSESQARVLRVVAALLVLSVGLLVAGAWIESSVTPRLVRRFVPEPLVDLSALFLERIPA